jgi:hypothetical protein
MAGGALGGLSISLTLETANFHSAMTKAAYQMQRDVGKMVADVESAAAQMATAFKAVAGSFVVVEIVEKFAGMVSGALQAQEELGRLAERAGMTGAQLSSLNEAAKLSHTSLDDVANMSAKLSKGLVESQVGTSKQAAALKALGISAVEAKAMLANPAEGLLLLSKRMQNFAVDGNMSAVTMLLIGKNAQEAIPFLNRLAQEHELVAKVTDAQIKAATEYEDRLVKLGEKSDALKRSFANALLPTMTDVVDTFTKVTTGTNSAKAAIDSLAASGEIKRWAQATALGVAGVVDALGEMVLGAKAAYEAGKLIIANQKAMGTGMAQGAATLFAPEFLTGAGKAHTEALAEQAEAYKRVVDSLTKSRESYVDALKKQFAASANARTLYANADREAAPKPTKPSVATILDNAGAQNAMRKAIEGDVKILEQWIKQEEAIMSQRESMLSRFYGEGLIGIQDYFGRLNNVRQEELTKVTAFYNAIIADYEKGARGAKTEADAIAFRAKATETGIKLLEFQTAAANKSIVATLDDAKAQRDYADSIIQTQAAIANAMGKGGAFAGPSFDIQHRTDYAKAVSSNDPGQVAALNQLKQIEIAKGRINDLDYDAQTIQTQLATAEGRATLAQTRGSQTEIQTLAQQGVARLKAANQMSAIVDDYERVARASGDPRMIANAEAFRLKIDELRASSDALAKKFTDMFENDFSNALTSFIDGTKSAKDAFKDFTKSLQHDLASMASKSIANMIFGTSGPLGGLGGGIAGMFGAGGGMTPGSVSGGSGMQFAGLGSGIAGMFGPGGLFAGAGAGLAAMFGMNTPGLAAGLGLDPSLLSALTAGGMSEGTTAALMNQFAASPIGFGFPGFAEGGPVAPNVPYLVGERGAELFIPQTAGTIVPNGMLGGKSVHHHTTINVLPGASTKTADQAAVSYARQASRAAYRNS